MRVRLSAQVEWAIHEHGADAYPDECCGALLGSTRDREKSVVRVLRIDNARTDSAHNRFLVTDKDYVRVEREAADLGLTLLGFYHSHPDHPARPSRFDLEHAMPWFSYVIVSVAEGIAEGMTSWVLAEDRECFLREIIAGEKEQSHPGKELESRWP